MTEIFQTILSCHVSRPADSRVLRCQSRLTDQPAGAHLLPSPTNDTRTSPNPSATLLPSQRRTHLPLLGDERRRLGPDIRMDVMKIIVSRVETVLSVVGAVVRCSHSVQGNTSWTAS